MTRVAILAIDPGLKAGACIAEMHVTNRSASGGVFMNCDRFALLDVRTVKPRGEAEVIRRFVEAVGDDSYVVVAESWSAGGWRSHKTLMGMGAAWERWRGPLADYGVVDRRIFRLLPREWRNVVIGRRKMTRDQWKAAALRYVENKHGLERISDDAAEAVCLAEAIAHDQEAMKVGANRPRKRLGIEGAA